MRAIIKKLRTEISFAALSVQEHLTNPAAEISLSARHQGVTIFSSWRTLQSLHFFSITSITHGLFGLRLYNCRILAIMIMFIYSGTFSFETLGFWFATLQCQMTLSSGKSKCAGLKWQQCYQNQYYCYINARLKQTFHETFIL